VVVLRDMKHYFMGSSVEERLVNTGLYYNECLVFNDAFNSSNYITSCYCVYNEQSGKNVDGSGRDLTLGTTVELSWQLGKN